MSLVEHLPIVPIVLPLLAGAGMLLFDERAYGAKAVVSLLATTTLVAAAVALLHVADTAGPQVYRLGNWPAPFGIVLVADRLGAVMALLASVLGLAALLFSLARWHRAGPRFHVLVQFLLMGVNGAFLTGDIFNLFVFVEVLLAASYGLALHGSGGARVRAGLHYIVVNLFASLLLLVGISLVYNATGTLNLADLALRTPGLAGGDRVLLEIGVGTMGVGFLVKAGMWPLCFWLPPTYSAASAPSAALFAVLTKVGVYIVMRLATVLAGPAAEGEPIAVPAWIAIGGMATLAFGTIGLLASQDLSRLASYSLLVSSGTLLALLGAGIAATSAALYYLVASTLGVAAFFLLAELVDRGQGYAAAVLALTAEAFGEGIDDEPEEEPGVAIPGAMAVLAVGFFGCALTIAGLPPLAGFIAKFAILDALLDRDAMPAATWLLIALLVVSGLAAVIGLGRAGVRRFWARETPPTRVRLVEIAPVALLLGLGIALTINAAGAIRYFDEAARDLHQPSTYARSVLR